MFNPFKNLFGKKSGKGKAKGPAGGKGPLPGKDLPPDKGQPPPGKGNKGQDKKGAPSKSGGRKRGGKPPEPPPGLSLDRKLDIIGIVLFFLGLVTLLSFFASRQAPILEWWLGGLYQLAGWGAFLLPFGFIAVGLWLVLRKFGDKLPKVEPERLLGIGLLYLALLATLHFATPANMSLFDYAAQGQGGGKIGAGILSLLFWMVGETGSVALLAAWWIIALVFTLGRSVPEIVMVINGWVRRLRRQPPADAQALLPLTPAAKQAAKQKPSAAPPTQPPTAQRKTPPPEEVIVDKRQPVPIPASAAAPAYDQPLVIGGDQVWTLPEMDTILDVGAESGADDDYDRQRVKIIESTLASFGAPVKVVEVNRGPTITQFGVEPEFMELRGGKKTKVKVGKIAALADDLALALSAQSIRIEAPAPGKGYVGIEVPNVETSLVALRDVMESEAFKKLSGGLRLGLGQDVSGTAIAADLSKMPHLLIAGTTGSGKSVCVNTIIACLLLQNTPDDLKFLMVDPKRVELTTYNGIPHLLAPVVVDLERVVSSLQWVTREMDERYRKFAKLGVRNIADFNVRAQAAAEKKMPYLVVIIDELADLMMLAPDETERTITRLAQLARATGIHLIIATQRPSVDVVTGLIKANFPARIAFAVASSVDSRVILDQPGAERLLGRGDMLFQSPDSANPLRMQGVYVAEHELQKVVRYWKGARTFEPLTEGAATAASPAGAGGAPKSLQPPLPEMEPLVEVETRPDGEDELLEEAIKAVREMKKASISLLQRRLRIGYTRAARLIDVLEEKGIIGPAESGAKPREVISFGDQVIDPTQNEADGKRRWSGE